MTKLTATLALLTLTATSAFHIPQSPQPINPPLQKLTTLTTLATTAALTLTTSPLLALAEQDDDYVYGAVAAPGGLGLAAGLGVLAILTAAVPVVLAPGEDAFNEMKDRDQGKWGKK